MINAGYLKAVFSRNVTSWAPLQYIRWCLTLGSKTELCRNAKSASNKKEIFFSIESNFSCPQPSSVFSPCCVWSICFPLSWDVGRSCFASCQLYRQDCVTHPPLWGSGSKSASQTFSVLLFKLHHHLPLQPSVLPSSPAPPLSCTWLFFLARLLLSVMPLTLISAPTLYLFSPSHISLHCFVVPVPFSSPPLFLAILKNCNDTVTASPEQNEIQFACQKP